MMAERSEHYLDFFLKHSHTIASSAINIQSITNLAVTEVRSNGVVTDLTAAVSSFHTLINV